MTAKACCPVGRRGDVGAINAALRAGMKVREVANLYGIGKTGVGEHRKNCLRLEDTPKKPEPPDEPAPIEPPKTPPAVPPTGTAAPVPDKEADSGQRPKACPPLAKANQVVFEAPRARQAPQAKDAKTFTEQALVCADMIAVGAWEGRASVRWLSALWGLSGEAVRERHRAGAVAAEADRGHIEAERQVSIGALQEHERIALEAFEASRETLGDEGDIVVSAGDPKFLAVAQKARADIARIAGCIPPTGTTVNLNIWQQPQFVAASSKLIDTVQETLDAVDDLVQRLAKKGRMVPRETAAALLSEAQEMLDEKMAAEKPRPMIEGTGEAA